MKQPSVVDRESSLSIAQRRYLYSTAAVSGAAIMVIEILGAKMLAPYFGTSHFVWTAQIAVTLVALATGYYCGGRWVDRSPHPTTIYLGLLAAGLYLCAAVTRVEWVAYVCLHLSLALGSLLASAFLFLIPLTLLGAVGPFLVRLLTDSMQNVGGSVGRLTAVSTLGSFVGTMLIGYILIPLLPNSLTMIGTAGGLMLLTVGWLLVWARKRVLIAVALTALVICLGCGWSLQSKRLLIGPKLMEVYRANSNFGLLQVIQSRDGAQRYLLNDFLMQGAYDARLRQSSLAFSYLLHGLARAYVADVNDVLVIGLGVGLMPMQFTREGVQVDAVEINPDIVPLAQRYFDFDPEQVRLAVGDGRHFLNTTRQRYDVIILDAFLGDSAPSHLMSHEAFVAMRQRLRPGGVVIVHAWGNFEPGRDFLAVSLHKTLASVFPHVRIHCDTRPQASVNVLAVHFVASTAALDFRPPQSLDQVHPLRRDEVRIALTNVVEADSARGIVLTDDYNPVDYYDAGNRERERRAIALRMRP